MVLVIVRKSHGYHYYQWDYRKRDHTYDRKEQKRHMEFLIQIRLYILSEAIDVFPQSCHLLQTVHLHNIQYVKCCESKNTPRLRNRLFFFYSIGYAFIIVNA